MSFAAETRTRVRPILPMAAMVDVLFLLLIFFMTASVMREQETSIPVELPVAETGMPTDAHATPIIVTIDAENRMYLGPRELDVRGLRNTLGQLVQQFPNESVVVRVDQKTDSGVTVSVFDLARAVGFSQVVIATVQPLDDWSLDD